MEFFRHCPGCGRRFHIKLENKKLLRIEREEGREGPSFQAKGGHGVAYVGAGGPVIVDIEEFVYNYKCTHCGHEWSEKHVEEYKEG